MFDVVLILFFIWLSIGLFISLLMALMAPDEQRHQLRSSRRIVMWAWLWPGLIFWRLARGLKALAKGNDDD